MTGRKENFSSNVELKLNFELKIVRLAQTNDNMTAAGGVISTICKNRKHKLTLPPSYLVGKFDIISTEHILKIINSKYI